MLLVVALGADASEHTSLIALARNAVQNYKKKMMWQNILRVFVMNFCNKHLEARQEDLV